MGCCCSTEDETGPPSRPPRQTYGSGGGQKLGGGGQALGGGGVDSNSDVAAKDAAAMAAMERANAATGSGASERDRKLLERRQKDDLIGKIYAHYQQVGRDPPIGLAASSIEQLKKHLDYIKNEGTRNQKVSAAATSMGMNL